MSDKIAPALTPEEWKDARYEFAMSSGIVLHDDGDGLEFNRLGEGPLFKILYGGQGYDFRALAAMALHFGRKRVGPDAEPFGFTREDVRFLREDAETHRMEPEDWHADVPILLSLAARIEALLPPLPPEGT